MVFALVLTCLNVVVSNVPGGVSVDCAPIPSPSPIVTPAPIPTLPPTPAPTTAAQAAQACANSIVNGSPLPPCIGTALFPGFGPYRRIIPPGAQADPNSAKMISAYFGPKGSPADVVTGLMWHVGVGQEQYAYGRPLYRAAPSDPLVNVECQQYCAMGSATVRIPAHAKPEGGSDAHLSVYEPDGTLFDAWEASGGPQWASIVKGTAGSLAISTIDGTAYSSNDIAPGFMTHAVTAGGMVGIAGVITLAELQAGTIQHELYGVVSCVASSWVPPATQGGHTCTDGRPAIPMGALLQYVPDGAAIAASSMSAESKIIAIAAHTYGIRIADTGGSSGLMIQVENQASFWSYGSGADPFVAYAQAHGWSHVVNTSVDRYIHPLNDLALPTNLRVLATGN
jgi:hypothetical protein